jgi:hypothetical protein
VLQREVAGYIEEFNPKNFVIHPSFCQSDAKWALAERLRILPKTMAYVNEDGGRKCSINCGTVIKDPRMRLGGCPHLFGNVVLAVYQSALAKAGISTADLRVQDVEEEACHAGECGFCEEPSKHECSTCADWFCEGCISRCVDCNDYVCEECEETDASEAIHCGECYVPDDIVSIMRKHGIPPVSVFCQSRIADGDAQHIREGTGSWLVEKLGDTLAISDYHDGEKSNTVTYPLKRAN